MHTAYTCLWQVLEGKTQYVEFAGNLVPVTKSGEQLQLSFRGFRENRLPFTVRVKDPHADCVGRTLFMREARVSSNIWTHEVETRGAIKYVYIFAYTNYKGSYSPALVFSNLLLNHTECYGHIDLIILPKA